jgi:hypothetical protein
MAPDDQVNGCAIGRKALAVAIVAFTIARKSRRKVNSVAETGIVIALPALRDCGGSQQSEDDEDETHATNVPPTPLRRKTNTQAGHESRGNAPRPWPTRRMGAR